MKQSQQLTLEEANWIRETIFGLPPLPRLLTVEAKVQQELDDVTEVVEAIVGRHEDWPL